MLRNKDGMGLVEIVVTMLILGFVLTMVMRTLPDSNIATTHARNITKASNLAQEKLEQLMSTPYADAQLAHGTHTDTANPIDGAFNRSWTVQDGNPLPGMKNVVVRVNFPTAQADSTVFINSIISSRW